MPRKMEELIAGGYKKAGFDEVILTPRSADGGKDVVAVRRGVYQIRIYDQVKRYSPTNKVTADEVRAVLSHLLAPDVTKVYVTTTSEFAPGIANDPGIAPYRPFRLELRDGRELREWLKCPKWSRTTIAHSTPRSLRRISADEAGTRASYNRRMPPIHCRALRPEPALLT